MALKRHGLTPIPAEVEKRVRGFRIDSPFRTNDDGTPVRTPVIRYKDGTRVKYCCFCGQGQEFETHLNSLGLIKGTHYCWIECHSFNGPYPAIVMYVQEASNERS